MMLLKLQRDIQ